MTTRTTRTGTVGNWANDVVTTLRITVSDDGDYITRRQEQNALRRMNAEGSRFRSSGVRGEIDLDSFNIR